MVAHLRTAKGTPSLLLARPFPGVTPSPTLRILPCVTSPLAGACDRAVRKVVFVNGVVSATHVDPVRGHSEESQDSPTSNEQNAGRLSVGVWSCPIIIIDLTSHDKHFEGCRVNELVPRSRLLTNVIAMTLTRVATLRMRESVKKGSKYFALPFKDPGGPFTSQTISLLIMVRSVV